MDPHHVGYGLCGEGPGLVGLRLLGGDTRGRCLLLRGGGYHSRRALVIEGQRLLVLEAVAGCVGRNLGGATSGGHRVIRPAILLHGDAGWSLHLVGALFQI